MSVKQVAQLRTQIAALLTELETVRQGAIVPLEDALTKVEDWIAARGAECQLHGVSTFMLPQPVGTGLHELLDSKPSGDRTRLECRFRPQEVYEQIRADLEVQYATTDRPVLSAQARQETLARLQDELLSLEQREEAAIRDLEARGETAPVRRSDIHFLDVVLQD